MPTAVPLPQMVDLALGSPEVGAVNFNVLHTLLHAMISKLGLGDVKADLNDDDREFLSTGTPRRRSAELTRADDSALDESILSEYSTPGKTTSSAQKNRTAPYHKLESRVEELARALQDLNSLPKTKDFFEGNSYRVPDMWQGMQLKKRVDGNEEGVGKLMMMMQDLMKEIGKMKDDNQKMKESMEGFLKLDVDDLLKRLEALEKIAKELREDLDRGLGEMKDLRNLLDKLPNFDDFGTFVRWTDLEDALKGLRCELDKLNLPPPQRIVVEMAMQTEKTVSRPSSNTSRPVSRSSSGPSQELLDILESLGSLSTKHVELEQRVKKLEDDMLNKLDKDALNGIGLTEDMLQELNKLKADIDVLKISMSKDHDALNHMQQMLKMIEAALEKLKITTQELTEDCTEKGKRIKKLYEVCDGLEKKKADKEYVDTEVDVKADKKQLDAKVNHNLFDDTTNEINRTIQEILKQLAGNSDEWKNMLSKLMNDIDGKLDRIELTPLKDWLEKKLKALSKKIQDGQLQWSDDEAAGLKKQLIQHYHCLSCDKPINLMPTGLQVSPVQYSGMPPSRSPRPYTTYELDQIRQHAKSGLEGTTVDYYATTRQCGGPHTSTVPHQRFSRNFNQLFKEETTDEIIHTHKEEIDVLGADGHIYRGRVERIDAKLPGRFTRAPGDRQNSNSNQIQAIKSATQRPTSARSSAASPQLRQYSASSGRNSRPHSARPQKRSDFNEQQSALMTEEAMMASPDGEITVALPYQMAPVKGESG